MTLVYTDNGSTCINDAAVESIIFLRESKEVRIFPLVERFGQGMPFKTITDVLKVIYNVQAEQNAINDSCQELLDLRKDLEERRHYSSKLRAIVMKLWDKYPHIYDELIEECIKENPKLFDDEQNQSKPSD